MLAAQLLAYDDAAIAKAVEGGVLMEVKGDDEQYRSQAMASIHETAEGLHAVGIMDKQTMHRFDEACLTPVLPLPAEEIKALREREGASQGMFAR